MPGRRSALARQGLPSLFSSFWMVTRSTALIVWGYSDALARMAYAKSPGTLSVPTSLPGARPVLFPIKPDVLVLLGVLEPLCSVRLAKSGVR